MNDRMMFYIKGRPKLTEPYHLKSIGLPNVFLLNGVTFEDDPDYGPLVTIEDQEDLQRAIGLHIIERSARMTGVELRFLRKQLGWTQKQLGRRLRVSEQTVANYEKGKTQMGTAEAAVRLLYALHVLPPETSANIIRRLLDMLAACTPGQRLPDLPRRKIVGPWQEPAPALAA